MNKNIDLLEALGLPALPSDRSEVTTTLLWAREILQKHLAATYAVKNPQGIEELRSIKIGGVDQWLHIRGNNRDNPVLLYLHGGPGYPMIGYEDSALIPWEDYFTVVRWDQRQTGKSYYPANDETDPLTIKRFIQDAEELIQYLQDYLHKKKLVLLGHSWGSVLGMHIVKRHPDWLHAYIGIGQVVNMMDSMSIIYQRTLHHAREQKKDALVAKLEASAPYPDPENPVQNYIENGEWLARELSQLAGENTVHHLCLDDAAKILRFARMISPHLTLTDISNHLFGDKIALMRPPYNFTREFLAVDLPTEVGSSFEVPIFFFTGSHDYQTPVSLSDQWFSEINAPHKELVHFEESAHIIINEEPGKLLVTLVNKVLPFTKNEE